MMENFIYGDSFYMDIEALMNDLDLEDDLSNVEDDWEIECFETTEEPLFKFDLDWIMERIDEERWPDDEDRVYNKIAKLMEANVNFDAVNAAMPKLHYENRRKKFTLTKKDLQEYLTP